MDSLFVLMATLQLPVLSLALIGVSDLALLGLSVFWSVAKGTVCAPLNIHAGTHNVILNIEL